MKRIDKCLVMLIATGLFASVVPMKAQKVCVPNKIDHQEMSCHSNDFLKKTDFRVDWQVNAPISTDFADQISGWGMNFELTYELTPRWEAGIFTSFHTNLDYVGRETLRISPTESLTTDQNRSLFQIPFGLTTSYTLVDHRIFRPYVGLKLGTLYSRNKTYTGLDGWVDKSWGFYASPELGVEIYPFHHSGVGFRFSAYYGYGTNQCDHLAGQIQGINDLGFRLGIVF